LSKLTTLFRSPSKPCQMVFSGPEKKGKNTHTHTHTHTHKKNKKKLMSQMQ